MANRDCRRGARAHKLLLTLTVLLGQASARLAAATAVPVHFRQRPSHECRDVVVKSRAVEVEIIPANIELRGDCCAHALFSCRGGPVRFQRRGTSGLAPWSKSTEQTLREIRLLQPNLFRSQQSHTASFACSSPAELLRRTRDEPGRRGGREPSVELYVLASV